MRSPNAIWQAADRQVSAAEASRPAAGQLRRQAIRKVGADRAKVRDAIESLKDYVGVTAVYSYAPGDHFGAKADSVVLLTVKRRQTASS